MPSSHVPCRIRAGQSHAAVEHSCTAWARFAKALELVAQLGVAILMMRQALLTLRTYALYDRRRAVLFAVALLGLGIPTTGAVRIHGLPWLKTLMVVVLAVGNNKRPLQARNDAHPIFIHTPTLLVDRVSSAAILYSFAWLAFDTGVIALTLYRIKQLSHGRRFDKMGTLSLILHHGFIYYVVLSFMNITNIVVYFTTPIGVNGIGIYLGRAISVVSISHLLLDLRETFAAPVSSVSPIAFRGSAMTDSSLLASNEWRGRGWSRIPDSYSSRGSTQSQSMPEAETGILLQKMGMGRRSGDTDTMDESRNSEDTLI
ncbi:hypothetical protein JB92DRAFT_2827027 [Gautieria morchelliformis]|nr:hypothetical protein JB92DRAFT_2827027 [Gautieria morchelliformis]